MKNFIILLFNIIVLLNPELVTSKRGAVGNPNHPTKKCHPRNCDVTLCKDIDCPYGVDPNVCGCCPKCLKGPGESCGGPFKKRGNCAEGLFCVRKHSSNSRIRGSRRGVCSCLPPKCDLDDLEKRCMGIFCPLFVCPFGDDPLACTCCPTCLKGPGQCCGGSRVSRGRCTKGFYCSDSNYQTINTINCGLVTAPVGSCRSNSCPDCNMVDCRPDYMLNCTKGTSLDPFCKCCSFCTKGLGETCGGPSSVEGVCEEGLVCEISPGMSVYQQGPVPPIGTCNNITITSPTDECECPSCAVVLCASADSLNCTHGSTINPVCGCCPVCFKGLGESCGGFTPFPVVGCGDGLKCQTVNESLPDAPGVCVEI
ncbi:UNVERIFIED_CONTAM: hypothetical protein RMT77_000959 [Armadillidium vulgare]